MAKQEFEMLSLYDGQSYDNCELDTSDFAFYVDLAKRASGKVLELACGTGRITMPIAAAGVDILATDYTESMLVQARKLSAEKKLNITYKQADFSNFSLGEKFKLVFVGYNSMASIRDAKATLGLFRCVREHLESGGLFALHVWNYTPEKLLNIPHVPGKHSDLPTVEAWTPYFDVDCKVQTKGMMRRTYNPLTQQLYWEWFLPGGRYKRECYSRVFFPQELEELFEMNGFEVVERYGDYDKRPFTPDSESQLFVGRLRS